MSDLSRFLVTFSNQAAFSGRPVLALVDVEAKTFSFPRDLLENDDVMASSGGAGICRIPTGYALILQGFPCRLCYLRHDLSLERVVRLSKVEDGHSVVWTGKSLLAVSTETNAVVEIGPDDEEKVIYYEGTPNSKSEHLNGIALDANSNVVLSGFGNRRGCGQAPRDGFLRNINTGEVLVRNLREPHSVQFYDGVMYTLESQTGNLVRSQGGRTISCFKKFFGYARGLAFNPDYIVVGQSAIRFGPRKPIEGDAGRASRVRASEGALHVLSRDRQLFLPLERIADEVFEIIAFPGDTGSADTATISASAFFEPVDPAQEAASSLVYRAWVARNAGRLGQAIELTEQALRQRPESASIMTSLGALRNQASQWNGAEAILKRALALDSANAQACSLLAEACLQLDKRDEAQALLEAAIVVAPRYKLLRHNLGQQYARLELLPQAEAVYRDMLADDPEGDSTQRLLAGMLRRQHRYAEALPHAITAVDLRSDVGEYYEFVGNLYIDLGDLPSAESFVREAIRLEPETETFQDTLLLILRRAGQHDAAIAVAREACRARPEDNNAKVRLGELLIQFADPIETLEWFRVELLAAPTAHRLYHALSRLLQRQGDIEGAIRVARQACQCAPQDPHCQSLLGFHLLESGLLDQAEAAFREALAIDASLAEIWFALGNVLAKSGKLDGAIDAIGNACQLSPTKLLWADRLQGLAAQATARASLIPL
jgi:tetratricopeptide (TPR) repeat protein